MNMSGDRSTPQTQSKPTQQTQVQVPALKPPAPDPRRRQSGDGTADINRLQMPYATPRPGRAGSLGLPVAATAAQKEAALFGCAGRSLSPAQGGLASPAESQLFIRRHSAHSSLVGASSTSDSKVSPNPFPLQPLACSKPPASIFPSNPAPASAPTPEPPLADVPPAVPARNRPVKPVQSCSALVTSAPCRSMSMGPPPLLPPPPPAPSALIHRRFSHVPSFLSALTEIHCQTSSTSGQGPGRPSSPEHRRRVRADQEVFPMPINMDFTEQSKASLRQDSSVSSDSYSQTSSPSYTSKTMETPLLPHHKVKKKPAASGFSRYSEDSCADIGASISSTRFQSNGSADSHSGSAGSTNSTSITKSHSTPASLQAVVHVNNCGSNLVHHKIIGDRMRRPSICRRRLRFRKFHVVQIIINVVALAAIAGGLAAYYRANPDVRYVNTEVGNPLPGVCMPVIVSFCLAHRIPYNYTVVPSHIGHVSQTDAQEDIQFYSSLVDVQCYELSPLFLCSIFTPKCGPNGERIKPCRTLCDETMHRCGFFLDIFNLRFDRIVRCDSFPDDRDSNYANVDCVGHDEVMNVRRKEMSSDCNGFQCDGGRRCIRKEWECDGFQDCTDNADESNCNCTFGQFHCGGKKCINASHVCNGISDCSNGQDEQQCVRVSGINGDSAVGEVQVYHPSNKTWKPACTQSWTRETAKIVCTALGYSELNDSHVRTSIESVNRVMHPYAPPNATSNINSYFAEKMENMKGKVFNDLRTNCKANYTAQITCANYTCGVRKDPTLVPTARIVGGSQVAVGDWPFLAAVLGGPKELFYCAGVLINQQWILTASHCVGSLTTTNYSNWNILLGMTRRKSSSTFGKKIKVKEIVRHPLYNVSHHDNDVALFQLDQPVEFNVHLKPVCLPSKNVTIKPDTNCTVIGWGKRENNVSEYETIVHEAVVPILNMTQCKTWLNQEGWEVTEGMICAGRESGGIDACQGDSGGPLLCPVPDAKGVPTDRWMVVGIVSWGVKCAAPKLPGVYAYVPKYVDWIKNEIDSSSQVGDKDKLF